MMIAEGFTCQRYGFNVGADKFSLLTIENGKNKHYAPIGMDIDFPKPKISLRQAASIPEFQNDCRQSILGTAEEWS